MRTIKIIGIDPSLTHTAYAIGEVDLVTRKIVAITEIATLTTKKSTNKKVRASSDKMHRARSIAQPLLTKIREQGIKIGTAEIPSGGKSASAANAFGISVGILASLPIPLVEVSPMEVKLASHGTKTASKEDIVQWAIDLTADMGLDHDKQAETGWKTSSIGNDWMIVGPDGKFVTLDCEHMADAIAAIAACCKTEEFRQLAAMTLALQ